MTTILLVESHLIVSKGIETLLKEYFQTATVIQRQSCDDIFQLLQLEKIDLLVIEPLCCVDAKLIVKIKAKYPELAILVCSDIPEDTEAIKLLKDGAHGFIAKNTSKEELFFALDSVKARRMYMSPKLFQNYFDGLVDEKYTPTGSDILTERELEIAYQLINGVSIKQIAANLKLSSPAISNQKNKIFNKLGIFNIIELSKYLKQ